MTGRERARGNTVTYKTQLKDIINNFSQPQNLLYRADQRVWVPQIGSSRLKLDFLHVICQMYHALLPSRETCMRTYRAEAVRSDRGPYLLIKGILYTVVAFGHNNQYGYTYVHKNSDSIFLIRIRVVGALNHSGERFEKNAVSVTGFTA